MTAAIVLFALAAMGGLLLASLRIRNKPLPMGLALAHGAAAAIGLVLLGLAAFGGVAPSQARIAFGLFVVAALGGFTLFSFHVRKQQLPLAVVVLHGLLAVVAFVILIAGVAALSGP
jgi:hypothetical protein